MFSLKFFTFVLLSVLSRVGSAAYCPPVNSIGHASPQQWVFANLNWTLIKSKRSGVEYTAGPDIVRVTFDLRSEFNDASVRCSFEGPEFGESYLSDSGGRPVVYNWYECTGASETIDTKVQMIWWNDHSVEVNQTWTCGGKDGSLTPYRATGKAVILGTFDCKYHSVTQARLWCRAHPQPRDQLAIAAEVVQVLPAPPRKCTAASLETPDWKVLDFKWVDNFTPMEWPWSQPQQNISFRLINEALDYSPRMICEQYFQFTSNFDQDIYFRCDVFEGDYRDVPETSFKWMRLERKLYIQQKWWCEDGPKGRINFDSRGERAFDFPLNCDQWVVRHEYFNETVSSCSRPEFEIQGKLV